MKTSAGILVYRSHSDQLEVFLVHPGGPFWRNKDEGAWSIPKGEYDKDEDALEAAKREFKEETGAAIDGHFIPLTPVKLKSGKLITAWAVEGQVDAEALVSNTIVIEWPPRSGKQLEIPEVDKGAWFDISTAMKKINSAQGSLVEKLVQKLSATS